MGPADFILWGIALLAGILASVGCAVIALTPADFRVARRCFAAAGTIAVIGVILWGGTTGVSKIPRIVIIAILSAIIVPLTVEGIRWVNNRENLAWPLSSSTITTTSLLFVFGAPLGDNDSASWVMVVKHYGPGPAYNCDIKFYDDDRKNIEHEWLVRHPTSPYPPSGLVGESQKRIYVAEASPEGSAGYFMWNPLDPNSQHYTVSISCRDGVFEEKWEVTRVDGILRSRIMIEHGPQWIKNNPDLKPIVFRYEDPEFVKTALATEMPKVSKGKVVHPGWKPNHKFNAPAAIIDPNGNVQVVSGVKLPDGSTLTDFGSWNILTRHFGDNQAPSKQP